MPCSHLLCRRPPFLLVPASFAAIVLVCGLSYLYWDIPLAHAVRSIDHRVHETFQLITRFGVSTGYLVMSFACFLFFRFIRRNEVQARAALFVFASLAFSGIVVDIFKFVFGRFRPQMLHEGLYGFTFFQTDHPFTSFPSGHAATITALALSISLLHRNTPLRAAAVLSAALVAGSRVIIGAHYPSDVLFGSYVAVVATLWLRNAFGRRGEWVDRTFFRTSPAFSVEPAIEGRKDMGGKK